jgi:hypothetical protein
MGVNAEYLLLKVRMKTAHDRKHRNKRHDPEGNAGYRYGSIKRYTPVFLLGFEITECNEKMIRTFHKAPVNLSM